MSRNKGKRVEYLLRDELRRYGYDAQRVPMSGASQAMKGDVVFSKDGKMLVAEVKARATDFGQIYALFEEFFKYSGDEKMEFVVDGVLINFTTSIVAALEDYGLYNFPNRFPFYDKYKRTFKKILTMRKLVKGCDVLVLKGDHKPFLYIRYRDV